MRHQRQAADRCHGGPTSSDGGDFRGQVDPDRAPGDAPAATDAARVAELVAQVASLWVSHWR